MKSPCYGCQDRALGCHGKCEQYAEYRVKKDKETARRRAESDANEMVIRACIRSRRVKRKLGGRDCER